MAILSFPLRRLGHRDPNATFNLVITVITVHCSSRSQSVTECADGISGPLRLGKRRKRTTWWLRSGPLLVSGPRVGAQSGTIGTRPKELKVSSCMVFGIDRFANRCSRRRRHGPRVGRYSNAFKILLIAAIRKIWTKNKAMHNPPPVQGSFGSQQRVEKNTFLLELEVYGDPTHSGEL